MSLLPFLVVTLGGTVAALFVRSRERVSGVVGAVVLVGAVVTALLITPDQASIVGGAAIGTTAYLRLFLVLGSVVGLLLAVVGRGRRQSPGRAGGHARPSWARPRWPSPCPTLAWRSSPPRRAGRSGRC